MDAEKATTRIAIRKTDAKKQIAYGEVYAPFSLDTHGEAMLPEDIELMAHRFLGLDLSKSIDVQHDNVPTTCRPVESFVVRWDDPDYALGAWVLGIHVPDKALWAKVESGELSGFSFEAWCVPKAAEVEYEIVRDIVGVTEPAGDGHAHAFYAQFGDDGNIRAGRTSPGPDGHVHDIVRTAVTEVAGDHAHRFFFMD